MLKLIPILIIILYYFNTMAQVIIKEEVDLNFSGDSPESVTLPATTSYGKVWGYVNFYAIAVNNYLHLVKIEAGGQTKLIGPACQGWVWETNWGIENVPSGSSVTVTVYDVCENGLPVEDTDTYVQVITPGTHFSVRFDPPGPHANVEATDVRYSAQTPPGCNPNFDCTEENFLPEINLLQQSVGYGGFDCPDDCNKKAFFGIPGGELGYSYDILNVCYSKQLQRWWFKLNNNHSFIFNYVLTLCEANIENPDCGAQTIIDDWQSFTLTPEYDCEDLIRDVRDHFIYPIEKATYFMRDIGVAHENMHKKFFEDIIDVAKDNLYERLLNDIKLCEDFNSISSATQYWNDKIKNDFTPWRKAVMNTAIRMTGGNDPEMVAVHEFIIHQWTMAEYWWLEDAVRFHYLCLFNP